MKKDIKKPLLSQSLATSDNKGLESAKADQHRDRISRFGDLKHRAKLQENYLWSIVAFDTDADTKKPELQLAAKTAQKLSQCGNYLHFKNYYLLGEIKLTDMRVCNAHLLCPFCAGIRASRSITNNNPKVMAVLAQNRKLKPVLMTLTVANGSDLAERQKHLMDSFRTLMQRCRDYRKKGRGFNEFCKMLGGFYSYENTYNEKTGEWHPHLHIFGVLEQWIDQELLSQTWHEITRDSYIVDIRRVKKDKELGYGKAIAEVCKYALKFSDLTVEKTWEAYIVLKGDRKVGLRLSGSFGLLNGLKIEEQATVDQGNYKDQPYLHMVYKFVFGKHSYYDLTMTRHVEPQALNSEKMLAGASAQGVAVFQNSVPKVRKKKHWQVSPYTRVRVKQRIRRWDGYLCVIHI